MRPLLLHLDDALPRQASLARAVEARGGRTIAAHDLGPALRLWTRQRALEALRDRLRQAAPRDSGSDLVFAGSGDFHHVTSLLVERSVEGAQGPVTIVHFDNHPDWVRHASGRHCGSWVGRAARLPGVARVITVGVCSRDVGAAGRRHGDLALIDEERLDVFAWTNPDGGDVLEVRKRAWPTIAALGEASFLSLLDGAIGATDVYVTIDKDVLRTQDAVTNWDQGQASLAFLTAAIDTATSGRRLVGADVVGDWSRPVYGGGLGAQFMKRAEARLDQPAHQPSDAALAVNEAVNLRLLDAFSGGAG